MSLGEREPSTLPGAGEWADALGLRRRGAEWAGACPLCGGSDRFHVRESDGRALLGCRGCIDGEPPDVRRRRYGEALRTAFPGRFERPSRSLPPRPRRVRAPESASERGLPNPTHSTPEPGREATTERLAARAWRAGIAADGSPVRVYLARRMAWPPDGCGPGLPPSMRWLPAGAAPPGFRLPPWAAGAMLCRYADAAGIGRAVDAEALTADGRRGDPRWRRTYGERGGAAFEAAAGAGARVRLCEGPVTALALSLLHPGERVLGVGGAGGLPRLRAALPDDGCAVTIEADGDEAGRKPAARTWATSPRDAVVWRTGGRDAADDLAALVPLFGWRGLLDLLDDLNSEAQGRAEQ